MTTSATPVDRLRRIAAAVALAASAAAGLPAVAAEPAGGATEARRPVRETAWFAFHSDFDFNLYDAVLTSATARRRERPDPMHDDCFAGLVGEERSAWDAAVGYYAATVAATRDFSRERFVVRSRLAGLPATLDADDVRDRDLSLLFLRAAAPAYRACRWAARDAANRAWIDALVPRLEAHAPAIVERLERAYGIGWRRWPIAVDVVETAGWAGADTIAHHSHPTHIQIASANPGYQGPAALEMIFHEASHELVSPREGPIARLLAAAAAAEGVGVDRNLWHGLLFVTTGAVTAAVLDAAGEGPYAPFAEANRVFQGPWEPLHAPLLAHWLPAVRGEADREQAARALVRAIGSPAAP